MARVLIIEPEPDLRRLAEEALAELGHEPVTGSEDAVAAPVDVLLLAAFTGMSALVSRLRADRGPLPLVCTGTAQASDEAHALRPAAYLVKPYTIAALDRALEKALGADAS